VALNYISEQNALEAQELFFAVQQDDKDSQEELPQELVDQARER
jgi:hypothetical protein